MRYLILLAALLGAAQAQAWMSPAVGGGRATAGVGGGGGTNPDWAAALDDNAASTTIVASYGADGTYTGANTSVVHTATVHEGTGAFAPTASTHYIKPGTITTTDVNTGVFTIQFALQLDNGGDFSPFPRLISNGGSETQLLVTINNSETSLTVYSGGSSLGNFTVPDIATGAFIVYRIIFDSAGSNGNYLEIYQGANEASLSLSASHASSFTNPSLSGVDPLRLMGNGSSGKGIQVANGIVDDIKIWTSVERP